MFQCDNSRYYKQSNNNVKRLRRTSSRTGSTGSTYPGFKEDAGARRKEAKYDEAQEKLQQGPYQTIYTF